MIYKTHVFDCDGVLLDSNTAKSTAFYEAARPYGEDAALRMVLYHQQAGSISRRQRWEDFFRVILEREPEENEVEQVLARCTECVAKSIQAATLVPGVEDYLKSLKQPAVVVSGTEQDEVREIIGQRGLTPFFDGIYGGSKLQLKSERLTELVLEGLIKPPAVYYGDTEDDYRAACRVKFDFVFVSGCSEFRNWRVFFADKQIKAIEDFRELLPSHAEQANA